MSSPRWPGHADLVVPLAIRAGQTRITEAGALQEPAVRVEICRVLEGGSEAFRKRWERLGDGGAK